jgi:hypothetical protein
MYTLLVHLANSEPIKVDVEELPKSSDQVLVGRNPRDHVERELHWVEENVRMIVLPWWRINYVQVLPSEEEDEEFPLPFRN